MVAWDERMSIDWAREIRGTRSSARADTPASASCERRSALLAVGRGGMRTAPFDSRRASSAVGFWTLTTTPAPHGSPVVAPAFSKRSSGILACRPRPCSTTTPTPDLTRRAMLSGARATRRSPAVVSRGTPICMNRSSRGKSSRIVTTAHRLFKGIDPDSERGRHEEGRGRMRSAPVHQWLFTPPVGRLPNGEAGAGRNWFSPQTRLNGTTMMRFTDAVRVMRECSAALMIGAFIVACGGSSEPDVVVATVEVSPAVESRQVGQTVQLSATVKDAAGSILSGQPVTWSSSAASVASVSGSGLVTAHALGTATITAASGSKSGVATINVIPPPIASITVGPTNDTLLVGETVQLTATMRDAANNVVTDRTVTWTSSSTTIASVSGSGLVTAVGDGLATITASADGRSATSAIQVFGPCRTIVAPTIVVGQTVNGSLASTDCRLTDDTYADGYGLTVTAVTNVQIDMTASFDTYLVLLELLNGALVQRAVNDDVDPDDPNNPSDPIDTNSRIVFALQPNAQYFILANSFDPNVFGNYQLKVAATTFIAGSSVVGKTGKAPVASLLKALKPK